MKIVSSRERPWAGRASCLLSRNFPPKNGKVLDGYSILVMLRIERGLEVEKGRRMSAGWLFRFFARGSFEESPDLVRFALMKEMFS